MSAHPKSEPQGKKEKHLLKKIQGSPTSSRAHEQDYDETVRRLRDAAVSAATPQRGGGTGGAGGGQKGDKGDKGDPGISGPDRFHKEGRVYVTVSPQHFVGEDPVPDPAQKHTLNDGYTECIRLVNLLTANGFSTMNDRVVMVVFGGNYSENLLMTNSRIDIQGIGRPRFRGISKVTTTCEKTLIDNIEFYNDPVDPRFPHLAASLQIMDGATDPSQNSIATIQIKNCWIHAPLTALYAKRWAYFENCTITGDLNEGTGYHAAVIQWHNADSQPRWTKFCGGSISGQNIVGLPLHKGPALGIYAVDIETITTWTPNSDTVNSGVILENLEVDGWTENYGWNMEYHACKIIGGQFINNSGAGSRHHLLHSHTNVGGGSGVNANTWITGGTEADVNYLVSFGDDNLHDAFFAYGNVRLRNIMHAAPTNSGGSVVQPLGASNNANVYGVHCATAKAFFFENLGAEAALLTSCDTSVDFGPPSPMDQGYVNY